MNNQTTEVKSLMKQILRHKELYYHGEPEISDYAYDALEDRLKQLDPKNAVLELAGWDIEGLFDWLKEE